MDTENVTYKTVSMENIRWMISITGNYYLKYLKGIYMLYTNWMIKGVWNAAKLLIDEEDRKNVRYKR